MKPRIRRTFGPNRTDSSRKWEIEVLESLADNNVTKLREALNTNGCKIDTQVISGPLGTPFDYNGVGFYDGSAADWGDPLLHKVYHGDTALHVAIRQDMPRLIKVICEFKANMRLANSLHETAIKLLWESKLDFEAGKTKIEQGEEGDLTENEKKVMKQRESYEELFRLIKSDLVEYHEETFDRVKKQLIKIYEQLSPERLQKLGSQLEQFYGHEEELLEKVKLKYELRE